MADTFLLTNVNSIRCLSVHAICEGGGISQSAEEYSARSVDAAVEGDAVFAGDLFGSSQVRRYFSAPAAGLACIRFVDQQRLGAGLPRFPQQEPLETVVSKGEERAYALASELSPPSPGHVLGFEGGQQDQVEPVDQEPCRLVVEFLNEVLDAVAHSLGGFSHVGAFAPWSFGGPADKVVEVLTEPLDSAEGAPADMAGVGFGVPGHEGPDAGVEGGYAGLAAVWYVFNIAAGWGGD